MPVIELKGWRGLNEAGKLRGDPDSLIDGSNFLVDNDGGLKKSWGTRKVFEGHSLKGITSLFFHEQYSNVLFALGLDGSDVPTLKMNDPDWRTINNTLFAPDDYIWRHSYRKNMYMFWGDKAAYFDFLNEGRAFPDTALTTTSTVADKLVDTAADFFDLGVTRWMRVHNITDDTYATITAVEDTNTLKLDADIMTTGEDYQIINDGLVDLDQINKANYLDLGGDINIYQPIYGFSPIIHNNALWLAGIGDYNNSLIFTRSYTNLFYDVFTGGLPEIQFVSLGGDDSASGSTYDRVTGIAEWQSDIFATKGKSCHRVVGVGTGSRSVLVNPKVGCEYPLSLQETKDGVIFLANRRDGFFIYNGQLTNISRPMIDDFLNRIKEWYLVRSGYFLNRYYIFSNGTESLVFDVDTRSWSQVAKSYNDFAESGDFSLCVSNKYSTTETTVTDDPERPGEPQQLLLLTPTTSDIVDLDSSWTYELDADGTGGSDLEFMAKTPFLDGGSKAYQKAWDTLVLQVQTSEPVISVDIDVDGNVYKDLRLVVDPNPLFDQAHFEKAEFASIPFFTARYSLDDIQMGYGISIKIKSTSKVDFKLINGLVYFRWSGRNSERNEP